MFGQFLLFDMNEELFTEWLEKEFGVSGSNSQKCFNALKEWSVQFLL